MSDQQDLRRQRILALADRCVKCGLCLPHCPTYQLAADESRSPRGRISLMQGLALGELGEDAALGDHLDSCLGCGSCETACPARVSYMELLDLSRAELAQRRRRPPMLRALLWLARRPRALRMAGAALAAAQRSGLLRMLTSAMPRGRLVRIANLLPQPAQPLPRVPVAKEGVRGRVTLFTGCLAQALDRPVIEAAALVLGQLGYQVHRPPSQTCCGALFQHNGDPLAAAGLARENIEAFAGGEAPIVYLASGCGAELSHYGKADPRRQAFSARVVEFSQFVLEHAAELPLRPLPGHALVHEPCTHRRLGGNAAVLQLLQRIPELEVSALPGTGCCGAGGSNLLTQPAVADALLAPKLQEAARADLLVTTNIGCSLHFQAGLRSQGTQVVHPAQLLARQLDVE